jgi:hypothetical protein
MCLTIFMSVIFNEFLCVCVCVCVCVRESLCMYISSKRDSLLGMGATAVALFTCV